MFETAGKTFFAALRDAVATAAAQDALNALGGEMAAVLMADVHKALREDPAAVLGAWQPFGNRH
ncbi:hypothetical protein [Ensifer aridi]|uniref:hypothetical protein n=1 Tax=Ensifer aridi TaxID=1708715 RepID=UPI000A1000F5|nr:hypothetical protein [Ensifer aridi]